MKYPGHLLKRYPTISHYFCSAAARVKFVLIGCFVQVAALDKSRLLTKRDSRIAATAKSWAIASRKAIAPSSLHCALHCIRMMWPTMPTCPWLIWRSLRMRIVFVWEALFSDALASLALMVVTDWLTHWLTDRNCRLAISHVWQLFHYRSSLVKTLGQSRF